jgi:hypothetical protein
MAWIYWACDWLTSILHAPLSNQKRGRQRSHSLSCGLTEIPPSQNIRNRDSAWYYWNCHSKWYPRVRWGTARQSRLQFDRWLGAGRGTRSSSYTSF